MPYLILQYRSGTGAVGPNATGTPLAEGNPVVGQTLTATIVGIDDPNGLTTSTFTYQWFANGSLIGGATDNTYTITGANVGQTIHVEVSFTDDAANAETLTSATTAAVTAAVANAVIIDEPDSQFEDGQIIRVEGSGATAMVVGNVLEARTDMIFEPSENGIPSGPFTYVWKRGATPIAGATSSTYTLQAADVGNTITLDISYTDSLGTSELVTETTGTSVVATSSTVYTDTATDAAFDGTLWYVLVDSPVADPHATSDNYYAFAGAQGNVNGTPFVVDSVYYDSFFDELYFETNTDLSGVAAGLPGTVTISDQYEPGYSMFPVDLYKGYLKTRVLPATFNGPGVGAQSVHSGFNSRGWDYPGKTIPTIYITELSGSRDIEVDLSEVTVENGFNPTLTEIYWYTNSAGVAEPFHAGSTEQLTYQNQTTYTHFEEDGNDFVFCYVVLYGNDDADEFYPIEIVSAGYNIEYNGLYSPGSPPPTGWG